MAAMGKFFTRYFTVSQECISEENDVTVLVQSCEESGTCVDVEECQAVTFTSGTEQVMRR